MSQISSTSSTPHPLNQELDNELSLLDIIQFIRESWGLIAGFILLGIAGATLFILLAPKEYEASAQIKMAQVVTFNSSTINSSGVNIEEPQALLARMSFPSFYSKETIALCGLADQKDAEVKLAKKTKLSIPKGVPGIVDLKIRDVSEEAAKTCIKAIHHLIKSSQAKLVQVFIDAANKRIRFEEERLNRVTQAITKQYDSESFVIPIFISAREEILFHLKQIATLQAAIASNEDSSASLTVPIYSTNQPVFPQKGSTLFIGFFFGGFLGLAMALARKWFRTTFKGPNAQGLN